MTDTHTHIYLEEYDGDRAAVMERAKAAGVTRMVFPNVDVSTMEPMVALQADYPDCTRIAAGLHPTEVGEDWRSDMEKTLSLLAHPACVAVGEVGIDLYWDKTYRLEQMEAFGYQVREAARRDLPVIIHCREGLDETLEVLRGIDKLPTLIFHSFTMGPDAVKRIREVCDPYFGINGVVTFKNAGEVREAVREIGLERIVFETDSPYLAPTPHRGKRNESSYLPLICAKTAEVLGVTPEEVVSATDATATRLFFPQ